MNSLDLIRMGLKNLFRRKLRTLLTTLGIVIGTISIVVMISLGIGMRENINKQLNEFGDLDVIKVYTSGGGGRYGGSSSSSTDSETKKKDKIENSDITAMKQLQGVDAVSPVFEAQVNMTAKKYMGSYIRIKGLTLDFMDKYGLTIAKGRLLEEDDKSSLVFGMYLPYNFRKANDDDPWRDMYDPETGEMKEAKFNPLEYNMKMSFDMSYGEKNSYRDPDRKPVRPINIKVVGVLSDKNWEKADCAYMEINELMQLKDKYDKMTGYADNGGRRPPKGFTQALVHVPNKKDIPNVQKEIQKMGFEARSDTDQLKQVESMMNTISMVFGGIGGIALLVAAIGITNTMVMAIYERRKEIGVMKVIGASLRDIKKLFLFEAASIGLLGGILGIILSVLLSQLINSLAGGTDVGRMFGGYDEKATISLIPSWLILSSLAFTSAIGLVSGYLPARKAMKLSALEAIKTD